MNLQSLFFYIYLNVIYLFSEGENLLCICQAAGGLNRIVFIQFCDYDADYYHSHHIKYYWQILSVFSRTVFYLVLPI